MSFDAIPVLDLALARDPATKSQFLKELRHALIEVGFLYIKNTEIPDELIQKVIENGQAFFKLPTEAKMAVQMKNQPSFLGYNVLGGEITAHAVDWREQVDLSTPHPSRTPDQPLYYNLYGPNQWPEASYLPSFRPIFEDYISRMSDLSISFTSLIAEALDMPASAFDKFFEKNQQHKLKIVRYPDLDELGVPPPPTAEEAEKQSQGVGPHKDSMLTSYLLQASDHRGLQAQNMAGKWIDCPPIPGTLVVAMGQGIEAVTHGVCQSTTHRVLSPQRGAGARYSIPFFQGVSYNGDFSSVDVPGHVRKEKDDFLAKAGGRKDDVEFTFFKGGRFKNFGEATLYNRAKSHMDVTERWYPEMFKQIKEDQAKGLAVNGNLPQKAQEPVVHAKTVEAH